MHLNVDVRQFWAETVELAENASHPRSNTYLHTIQPRSQGLCRQIKKEREKPYEQGWENQT